MGYAALSDGAGLEEAGKIASILPEWYTSFDVYTLPVFKYVWVSLINTFWIETRWQKFQLEIGLSADANQGELTQGRLAL